MANTIIKRMLVILILGIGITQVDASQRLSSDSLIREINDKLSSLQRQINSDADNPSIAKAPLTLPKVIAMGSMLNTRSDNSAVFGDYLYIQVTDIDALMAYRDSLLTSGADTLAGIILYVNGNPMRDIGVMNIDRAKNQLVFHLNRHSRYLMKFYPEFDYLWSTLPVTITAGFRNGTMLPIEAKPAIFSLKYIGTWGIVFALLMIVTILVSFIILAARTNLIRIGDNKSAFSLALTQLSFWTIVVAASFLYIWIATEEISPISGSTLILLSISIATTGSAKLIDIRGTASARQPIPSRGFFEDILSDELGYSVHRCQMFLWTAILGVIFVTNVITEQQMPQLDESLLALMGISSGAYVGLKSVENKKITGAKTQGQK